MHNTRRIAAVALAAGLIVSAGAAAAEPSAVHAVKPYQGIMLDVGSKQLGGYFVNAAGRCKLSVTIADAYREGHDAASGPTMRVQVTVDVDKPALLDTAEGKVVEFDCQNGAEAMSATTSDQVSYFVTPQ
jgi:hypothetical protein